MLTSDFDYHLPEDLIAQTPLAERDASRLMVLDRASGAIQHRLFRDLPELLSPGDLVVLNDTRVIPSRLFGSRDSTGGKVEVMLLARTDEGSSASANTSVWLSFTRCGGKLRPGEVLTLAEGRAKAVVVERLGEEGDVLRLETPGPAEAFLADAGRMPLPPYIRRDRSTDDPAAALDRERYQTAYARRPGAVAAPTAGLHFTERVFEALSARGVGRTFLTLHVGPGTFKPMKTDTVEQHRMHSETFEISTESAEAINAARSEGRRVVAVGTTVTRTLETVFRDHGRAVPCRGETDIFIFPGHRFAAIDALITNFHMPKGTPLLLASAFAGREWLLEAYCAAVSERYRFLSYGDAMLLL